MDAKEMLRIVMLYAEQERNCLRAAVGVAMCTGTKDSLMLRYLSHNGPVGKNKCSGEKGQCGCFHAEIRAVMKVLDGHSQKRLALEDTWVIICNYTPCTTCANFILQYGKFLSAWYYEKEYRNPRGMKILRDAGIICEKIS